jgi:hypothetical protein
LFDAPLILVSAELLHHQLNDEVGVSVEHLCSICAESLTTQRYAADSDLSPFVGHIKDIFQLCFP